MRQIAHSPAFSPSAEQTIERPTARQNSAFHHVELICLMIAAVGRMMKELLALPTALGDNLLHC